jgi:hypothetical protein
MRVHAFLATPAELPALPDGGNAAPRGVPLAGVDAVALASLVEFVTGGGLSNGNATAVLEHPVLGAGARGPFIHRLPAEAADALESADAPERARWVEEWTGGSGDGPERALETLAELAARPAPEQGLYLWVADGS